MAGTQVAAAGLGTSCDEFGTYPRHWEVSIVIDSKPMVEILAKPTIGELPVEGTHWRHMPANFVVRSSASDDPDKLRRRARRRSPQPFFRNVHTKDEYDAVMKATHQERDQGPPKGADNISTDLWNRRQHEFDAIQTATQQGKVTCRKVTYRKCARMCPWPCRKEFCTQCYSRPCINGCTDQAVAALDIATSSQEPAPPMLRSCGKCKKYPATYKCHPCDGRFCGACISKCSHCPKFTCIGDCTADHQCDNSSGGEYGNLDQDEPPSIWRSEHTPTRWPQRR